MLSVQLRRVVVSFFLVGVSLVSAQVQFDGSVGSASGLLTGDQVILESQGQLTSDQQALLHSFSLLSVGAGETLEFQHSTATVQNIIARVTGGEASVIDGRLVSDASLWLLNPNGVLVSENSQIDVAGSFRINTQAGAGAALVLADGSMLTVDTDLNTLIVAAPADFGFITDLPADPAARVTADTSAGTVVGVATDPNGQLFSITGGTQVGGNLFHSFERFSVFSQDVATFDSSSVLPLDNVISRITGDYKSFLTGSIFTTGAGMVGTSFWFVNPAGIFVGNGAFLDVGKSLNLGSADFIANAAGDAYRADGGAGSSFFSDSPANFGFDDQTNAGDLRLASFSFDQTNRISNTADDGISLVGGNVDLSASALLLVAEPGQRGNLSIEAPRGSVVLDGSFVGASTQGSTNAGRVLLSGARLVSNGSLIAVNTVVGDPNQPASRVDATFSESVTLQDSQLGAATAGAADSGPIVISAPQIEMNNGSLVTTTSGGGSAGGIILLANADEAGIRVTGSARLANDTTLGTGDAEAGGIFLVTTGDLSLAGSAGLPIELEGNAGVNAGSNASIFLQGENVLLSEVSVSSQSAGSSLAAAGSSDLFVQANNLLSLESTDLLSKTSGVNDTGRVFLTGNLVSITDSSLNAATSAEGNSSGITIDAAQLLFIGGSSSIISETSAAGSAGDIFVGSNGDLLVSGDDLVISSSSSAPVNGGSAADIFLSAAGDVQIVDADVSAIGVSGASGTVSVQATNIAVTDSQISLDTASDIPSAGLNGVGLLTTGSLSISNTVLSTQTSGTADALPIFFQGLDIVINNSQLVASTNGAGNASIIALEAPTDASGLSLGAADVTIVGSEISTVSNGDGSAGQINFAGQNLRVDSSNFLVETSSPLPGSQDLTSVGLNFEEEIRFENSAVSAQTLNASDAGRISISGQNVFFDNTEISNSSVGTGAAGEILLAGSISDPSSAITFTNSTLTSETVNGGSGEVSLVAGFLGLAGPETRISTSSSGTGTAGNIRLFGGAIEILDGASIESRATGEGNSNNIVLDASNGGLTLRSDLPGQRSEIRTDSTRSQGGDISLTSVGLTQLQNAAVVASAGVDGSGGNIQLLSNGSLINRSVVLAQAEAGTGGRIDIELAPGALLILDAESLLNSDSQAGSSGTVRIEAPDTGINSALAPQNSDLPPQVTLQSDACAPPAQGQRASTFFVRSKAKRDTTPDSYLGDASYDSPNMGSDPIGSGDCP